MSNKLKKTLLPILKIALVCCLCAFTVTAFGRSALAQNGATAAANDYALVLNDYTIANTTGLTGITDPNGNKVEHKDGVFMPLCVGEYQIVYSDRRETLRVLRDYPTVSFEYAFGFSDGYSTGDTLYLPEAKIESVIGVYENYSVSVACDGEELRTVHSSALSGFSLVLDRGGNYTVTYSCTDNTSLNYTAKDEHNFVVLNDATLFMNELPSRVDYGSSVSLGAVYGLYDGVFYPAELTVTLPSGETETVDDIVYTPTSQGRYVFTASSDINGTVKTLSQTVEVVISSSSLFTNTYAVSQMQAAVDLPSYARDEGKGLFVQARNNSAYMYYSKIIDLKTLDKNVPLIEFIPYSDGNSGNQDEIKVTLTDVHNVNVQLTLKWWYRQSVSGESYMSVYLNGKEYGAINNEKTDDGDIRKFYGSVGWGCFFNAFNQGQKTRPFNLRFDYAENAVYSNLRNRWSSDDKLFKIIDMDDPLKLGYANIWNGFTTGEVYLKVEFTSSQPVSGIYVQSVAGVRFDEELLPDETNDTCFLVESEYAELPDGAVGYYYSFPKIVKNFLFDTEVTTTLKKGGETVSAGQSGFTPTVAGAYTLVYSAIDNYGKLVEKSFGINVRQTPNTINVDIPAAANVEMYTEYEIPDFDVSGGSGNLTVEKSMTLNGKPLASFADAYLIDSDGDYVIEIKVTDFIGYTVSKTYPLNVNRDYVSLVLERELLAVRAGKTVVLPQIQTYDFYNSSTPSKTLEIIANGSVIKTFSGDAEYSFSVPANYGELTLKYYSGKGTAREKTLERTVKVLPADISGISDFVITEGTVSPLSLVDGILYVAQDDATVKFPNPVPADGLSLVFGADADSVGNFGGFTVRLTDALNPAIVAEFRYYDITAGGTSKLEVNGDGRTFSAKYTLNSYANYSYGNAERASYIGKGCYVYECYYDGALNKMNYKDGTEMASVSVLANGHSFEGFPSGLVFVEFGFNDVTDVGKIMVKTVSNQNMDYFIESESTYKDNDTQGPNILYKDRMVNKRVVYNSEITVSAAEAYDFIQSESSKVRVIVKDPSGKTVIDEYLAESRKIILNQYGTYTITYRATDSLGKGTSNAFNVVVYDDKPPVIILNDAVKNEYAVGSELTIPACTVTDNYSKNLTAKIYMKTPDGDYKTLTAGTAYKFERKGCYVLVYSAQDEFGNIKRVTCEITVK